MNPKGLFSTSALAVAAVAIMLATVAATSSPSTPYIIHGKVFYRNGTVCNGSMVNITNMNNSNEWTAKTNASCNYYQLMLANGTDLNASEVLQFYVTSPDGEQSKVLSHVVTETEVNNGGLFNYNITLEAPPGTPFIIYGWVHYNNGNGTPCNGSSVNITNMNTSMHWQAETNATSNYFQLILDTTNVSAGNVLVFNVSDGTQFNTTNHTVTQSEINNGVLFNFNLTLPIPAAAPVVESITITPDDDDTTPGVQIDPNPGDNVTVNISAVVSDSNGWEDINTVAAVITGPGTVADSPVTLNLVSHDTTTATFNGTFNMSFYYANGSYSVNVTATDMGGLAGSGTENFTYKSCIGLSIDAAAINFGTVDPGENSSIPGDENYEEGSMNGMTIRNIGNVEIDLNIEASDMAMSGSSGTGTIANDNIYCGFTAGDYGLNLGSPTSYDLNLDAGAESYNLVNFRLHVPTGTAVGNYSGDITMTATAVQS